MMRFFGPAGAAPVWYDLIAPTDAEIAEVERATGRRVPSAGQVIEIESSSRLQVSGDVFMLTTPAVSRGADGAPIASALGFVLTPQVLLSVRSAVMPAFEDTARRFEAAATEPASSLEAFVVLFEAMIDHSADVLEGIAAKLDAISATVFRPPAMGRATASADRALLGHLQTLGQLGDHVHKVRDALLGARRIIGYVTENATGWTPPPLGARLTTLLRDIESLREYDDDHLANKIQFLLDATLGFITIAQSNIFKVLTVVSLVGIPPTLLAGIWGMNFKEMPELSWPHGYAFAWAMMGLSAVLPVVWFRARRWI